MTAPATVTFRIRRYDPATEQPPVWEDISIPYTHGMTVLDGLRVIKETRSATLAWRSSCRMGVCGSCGMFINGHPRLACNTQITELGTQLVTVAPLPNFAIIRDLVPDLRPMFDAHAALMPHISATTCRRCTSRPGSTSRRLTSSSSSSSSRTASSAGAAWPRARRWPPTRPTRARCRLPSRTATTRTAATAGSTGASRCWPPRRARGSAITRASARRPARRA